MATDSPQGELPLVFYIAFGRGAVSVGPANRPPLAHPAGLRAITDLTITTPDLGLRATTGQRGVEQHCRQVRFLDGGEHLIEFGFDDRTRGRTADFRPALPLIIHW